MASRWWWTFTATSAVTRRTASIAQSTRGRSATGQSTFGRSSESGRRRWPVPAPSTTPATLGTMQSRRWLNPSQPQTLQIAVILLYMNAAFGLLLRSYTAFWELARWIGVDAAEYAGVLSFVGMAVAAFGIANEKKWGYL